MANNKQTEADKNNQAAENKIDNQKTGGLAGAAGGAIAGAQVGTVLLPIPIVGTFAGALVGGVLGSKVGKKVGGALLDKLDANKSGDAANANPGGKSDVVAELEKLGRLREQGILSEDEFKAAKAALLNI